MGGGGGDKLESRPCVPKIQNSWSGTPDLHLEESVGQRLFSDYLHFPNLQKDTIRQCDRDLDLPSTFLRVPATSLVNHFNFPSHNFFISKMNILSSYCHRIIRRIK